MKKLYSNIKNVAIATALAAMAVPCANAQEADTKEVTGWGDFKIFIDPGHSGTENKGLWGYSEAQKVLEVAKYIREYLTTYTDVPAENIKLCRETQEESVSLTERTDMANAWGADFYYSIHSDAGGAGTPNTTVTLFGGWRKDGVEIEKTPNGGKAFGEILNPNLTGVMRTTTRGNWYDRCYYDKSTETHTNQWPYLHVNRESNMASLLSEGGYHTIASQQQLNINQDYKKLEAFAAFQSILKYRGLNLPVQTFLTGIITNSENNVPISGATVTVGDKTYTTDTWESVFNLYTKNKDLIHNGFYLFDGIAPGTEVEVVFNAPGYDEVKKTVTIKSNLEGTSNDNVTWLDVAMTSNAPAIVSTTSIEDLNAVPNIDPVILTFSRKMDKASVESALTINNDGKIVLTWINDYTLSIDVSQLTPLASYTITIDGSIAKNSQTNQLFDGDADGVEGGNYVLTMTMAEPDTTAPVVVSTDPAVDGEVAFTLRPVIRVEFDEELESNEDKDGTCLTVEDALGNIYEGTLTHAVVREASVLHYYLKEDLPLDRCFQVTVNGGLRDASGNESSEFKFRFLSEYRGIVTTEVLLPLDDITGWWAPNGSGSSAGLTEEANFFTAAAGMSYTGSGTSTKLTYDFDASNAGGLWQIREYHSAQNITKATNDGIVSFWCYGDGSNNSISTALRVRTGGKNGGIKINLKPIDFRGWRLITWDLMNDSYTAFTGEDELGADWRLDAFLLKHLNTDNDPSVPQQAWKGEIYFDQLEFNKFDSNAVRTASLDDIKNPAGAVEQINVNTISAHRTGNTLNATAPVAIESINIYNAAGMRVMTATPNANTASINVGSLARGIYIAKVEAGQTVKTVKFAK